MTRSARALALATFVILSACATRPIEAPATTQPPAPAPIPVPAPVVPPPPANAIAAGVSLSAAPSFITQLDASRALQAFRTSCPVLLKRQDQSGLTGAQDWAAVCAEAATVTPANAAAFFRDRFDWVSIGQGKAFATGYYEPEIAGSRTPQPGYIPIYRAPPDLTRCTKPLPTTLQNDTS